MGVKKDERSEQPVDSLFFVPRVAVAIVDTGSPGEALLLRAVLESMGAIVTLHQPGTPEDFLIVLGQGERPPPFLVICGHGDDKGFIFGEFMPPIDTASLLGKHMPPSSVAARVLLPRRTVLSTACMTGTDAWGRAFIDGGVDAYIAPEDYPEGADVPLFVHHLFHHLLIRKANVEAAWSHAAGYDAVSRMFVFHSDRGARRLAS